MLLRLAPEVCRNARSSHDANGYCYCAAGSCTRVDNGHCQLM